MDLALWFPEHYSKNRSVTITEILQKPAVFLGFSESNACYAHHVHVNE